MTQDSRNTPWCSECGGTGYLEAWGDHYRDRQVHVSWPCDKCRPPKEPLWYSQPYVKRYGENDGR